MTRKIHYIIRGALERAVRWRHLGVNKAAMAEAPSPRRTRVTRKVVFPGQGWLEGSWGPVLVGVRGGWQSPAVPEFR